MTAVFNDALAFCGRLGKDDFPLADDAGGKTERGDRGFRLADGKSDKVRDFYSFFAFHLFNAEIGKNGFHQGRNEGRGGNASVFVEGGVLSFFIFCQSVISMLMITVLKRYGRIL